VTEGASVTRLVAFVDVPSLSEQVATVRVVSTCDCGCASGPDGGAVEVGTLTLLLPTLINAGRRRLNLAAWVLGVPVAPTTSA
jgi:hypothetical protein